MSWNGKSVARCEVTGSNWWFGLGRLWCASLNVQARIVCDKREEGTVSQGKQTTDGNAVSCQDNDRPGGAGMESGLQKPGRKRQLFPKTSRSASDIKYYTQQGKKAKNRTLKHQANRSNSLATSCWCKQHRQSPQWLCKHSLRRKPRFFGAQGQVSNTLGVDMSLSR